MIPIHDLPRHLPDARWVLPPREPLAPVSTAYTSDLLSDVLAHAPPDSVLITLQAHRNTIAVATLVGVRAVILCHHRTPPNDMIEAAEHEAIAIMTTSASQYEASWRLHQAFTDANPL